MTHQGGTYQVQRSLIEDATSIFDRNRPRSVIDISLRGPWGRIESVVEGMFCGLYWDRTGFALWYKRLERGKFPAPGALAQRGLTLVELHAWLEGIDIVPVRPHTSMTHAQIA